MGRGDHQHGQVAIGQAIGDRTNKAHDLAIDNRDVRYLRCLDQRTQLLNAGNALAPAIVLDVS